MVEQRTLASCGVGSCRYCSRNRPGPSRPEFGSNVPRMVVPSLFAAWSLIALGSLLLLVGLGGLLRFRWRLTSGRVLPGRVLRLVEVRTPQGWMSAVSVSFQIGDRTAVVEGRGTRWPDMKAGDRASVYLPAN